MPTLSKREMAKRMLMTVGFLEKDTKTHIHLRSIYLGEEDRGQKQLHTSVQIFYLSEPFEFNVRQNIIGSSILVCFHRQVLEITHI